MFRPSVKKKISRQKKYYGKLVQNLRMPDSVILDIGANEGFVSDIFIGQRLAVVAVEPDPRNIRILQARFQKYRDFSLYPCLCSAMPGFRSFWISIDNSAFSTGSMKWKNLLSAEHYTLKSHFRDKPEEIQATTMDEIIRAHGKIAFAKIDIEGSELDCLQGLSEKIPLIAFEANLPEFAEETISCIFHLAGIDPDAEFSYSSDFNFEMSGFLSAREFCKLIESIPHRNIDVICKMSNYNEFYGAG
jgi:FkbM family methyltransferase